MNEEGWIPLPVIAGFNRVRMLTPDAGMIICALAGSRLVELSADGMLLRPHSNWRQWVM
eukprot:jgi/Astpho2/534/gw1.00011.197.1_t